MRRLDAGGAPCCRRSRRCWPRRPEALPKAKGCEHGGRSRIDGSRVEPSNPTPTYAELGVTKKLASVAQQLAALPAATREAIAQREVTLSQAKREIRAKDVTRRVSLPDAKYRVLYADPPWSYNDKADAGAVQSGGAERHYPSLSIAETISDMSGLQSPHQARSQMRPRCGRECCRDRIDVAEQDDRSRC